MLIINEQYLREHVTMEQVIGSMEQAFAIQRRNEFDQPDRVAIAHGQDVFLLMPCFSAAAFSTKLLTTYPGNKQYGKPTTLATLLLNDMKTGEAVALINGTYLTGLRTGAVGGLGCKYLARPDATRLAVVGAGAQGVFQTWAAATVRPISDVYVYDAYPATLASYEQRLHEKRPDLNVHVMDSADAAAAAADVIVTCSTASQPVFSNDPALFAGKHITAIGSYQPTVRELPDAVIGTAAGVWLDTMYAAEESGDIALPLAQGVIRPEQLRPFCELPEAGCEQWQQQTTLLKSVGIGLWDLVAAQMIYQAALANGDCPAVEM